MEHRETEIKLKLDASIAHVAARLRSLGATLQRPRHFEDNYILDDARGRLRRSGSLLRVRLTPASSTLTFKGPCRIVRGTKQRDETETDLPDGALLLEILERAGMRCAFRYQKHRTIYRLASILMTVDETPIGNYLEVEGSAGAITRFARKLGFEESEFITATYHELFLSYIKAHHIKSEDMVFGFKTSKRVCPPMGISMGKKTRTPNQRGFQTMSTRRPSSR